MSNPSQSFLIVETVVLLLRPLMILFTVDCVTPLIVHSLLIDNPRSSQERYRSILDQADSIVYVNRGYSKNCMLERNTTPIPAVRTRRKSRETGR